VLLLLDPVPLSLISTVVFEKIECKDKGFTAKKHFFPNITTFASTSERSERSTSEQSERLNQ